jgi:hypothetical protein
MLNAQVPSADGSGDVPFLEFAIRAEVVNAWETYSLKAVFRDICLSSKTDWDLRTEKMLSGPWTLVNQAQGSGGARDGARIARSRARPPP